MSWLERLGRFVERLSGAEDPVPTGRAPAYALLYRRRGVLYAAPQGRTAGGMGLERGPVQSCAGDRPEEAGRLALWALERFEWDVLLPPPEERMPTPVMKACGARTWTAFTRGLAMCSVSSAEEGIRIVPYRNAGAEGMVSIPGEAVVVERSPASLGTALLRVLRSGRSEPGEVPSAEAPAVPSAEQDAGPVEEAPATSPPRGSEPASSDEESPAASEEESPAASVEGSASSPVGESAAGSEEGSVASRAEESTPDPPSADLPGDLPVPFGYKCVWLAVRATSNRRVAEALRLEEVRLSPWREGIAAAHRDRVFLTPPVEGWILAPGVTLPAPDAEGRTGRTTSLAATLSHRLDTEVLWFATHRIPELHGWVRARKGSILRGYVYLGERDEVLLDVGEPSAEEKALGVGSADFVPDEETVLALAGSWSVDPRTLEGRPEPAGPGRCGRPR